MTTLSQRSFSSGELSPSLYSRVDFFRYATGLRTCKNCLIFRYGGAGNRPGTEFIIEGDANKDETRIIPFIFNDTDSYLLRFGNNGSVKVYRSGAFVDDVQDPDDITTDVHPYLPSELPDVKYVQSADVIIFTHPNHLPQKMQRVANNNWEWETYEYIPTQDQPTSFSGAGSGGGETYEYMVTAVGADGEESLPWRTPTDTINNKVVNISLANPPVVTTAGNHGYTTGDLIQMNMGLKQNDYNGKQFRIVVTGSTTFTLNNIDGTNVDNTLLGGVPPGVDNAHSTVLKVTGVAAPTNTAPITLTIGGGSSVTEYNIYKRSEGGSFGLLGITNSTTFRDIGEDPDTSVSPPEGIYPFLGEGNYPANATFIQQRLIFSNTNNNPEKVFLSQTGDFNNFARKKPFSDDSAFNFNMAGKEVNEVTSVIDLGKLIVMTSGGEFQNRGGDSGVLSPLNVDLKQQSYNGSSRLDPEIVDGSAVYVQARGAKIRDLTYTFNVDGYQGDDLTLFANHLFDKNDIKRLSYQKIPNSILWCLRDDGILLGLTLVRTQQIIAWHRHDFGGEVEDICVIPEGSEDILYMVIKRVINGSEVRYIERMSTRLINDIKDARFMDSNLSFDGRNTTSTTMTLSGGTIWDYQETITLTASASFFVAGDIGNQIFLRDSESNLIRFEIQGFTSDTVVTGKPHKTVPASLRGISVTDWDKAVDELSGLDHLEGEQVSVFADGFVVASPNNDSYDTITVSGGTITLDKPHSVIHVGLPYLSDLETLDVNMANGETMSDKAKLSSKVNITTEDTRGVWAGPKPPSDDSVDPLERLTEYKGRNQENYDNPPSLRTEVMEVNISGEWNRNGRVFLRQVDPIPMTVLAIEPAGKYPIG